jgi:hypothetical protein
MICGLTIDLANVVMLTFVNAFAAIGAGNILNILGIEKITKLRDSGDITNATLVTSYIFGLLYVIIATVVVASMVAMLVMRVVMIWILTVLSPLAFFLQAVPGKGASYASQWWNEWIKNLLVGPILAFFLWLSFAALQTGTNPIEVSEAGDKELAANMSDFDDSGIVTEGGQVGNLVQFVIAIGMLVGGMTIAQSVGGAAGGAVGLGMKTLNKGKARVFGAGAAVGAGAMALGKSGVSAVGRGARSTALTAISQTGKKDASGQPIGKLQKFTSAWNEDLKQKRQDEKVASRQKYLKKLGFGEESARAGKEFVDSVGDNKLFSKINRVTGYRPGSPSPKEEDVAKAKSEIKGYETNLGVGGRADDESIIRNFNQLKKKDPSLQMSAEEEAAFKRSKDYLQNKDILKRNKYQKSFATTANAFEAFYKEKDKAKEERQQRRVDRMAKSKNPLQEDYYLGNYGFTEDNKAVLDAINNDAPGEAGAELRTKVLKELSGPNATVSQKAALASSIAAYKKSGGKMINLQELDDELKKQGFNSDSEYRDTARLNFKDYDANLMRNRPGQGKMSYDTFGKNSLKAADQRSANKDIMELSFGQLDKVSGEGSSLGNKAGTVLSGENLKKSLPALNSLIDSEAAELRKKAGANPSSAQVAKISQLEAIKARLGEGSLEKLELVNSDIQYVGETDSAKRANKYNTLQHEKIHGTGFTNEKLTYQAADALQENKLIGNLPNSNKRYDQELGKMMANMSAAGIDSQQIEEAMLKKIDEWKAPDVDRVLESEAGVRSNLVKETGGTVDVDALVEKVVDGFDKVESALSEKQMEAMKDLSQESRETNTTLEKMVREQEKRNRNNLRGYLS